ncbi:MAG: hypothetical protein Q9162_003608 [Coniocarpon cinnabarinum]
MEPWMSWALALGVGATGYYYYSRPRNTQPTRSQPRDNRPKDNTQKRQEARDETTNIENQKPKKRKQPREQSTPAKATAVDAAPVAAQDSEPEEDDRQWAQQLQAAKKGVSMTASKAANAVGASRPQKQADSATLDGANGKKGPASKDVSDMLEAAPAAPSSIRLTGEEKQKTQIQKKEEAAKETKKQRQNRKKNEERKANREDDERERKKLEENQRRSAREARGEPAKNGLAVAPTPSQNAWNGAKAGADTSAANPAQSAMLLDTFDHDATSTTSSNDPPNNARSPATAASVSSQNLPSEEEQMEAIREMNGWNEVKGRKGKKKASAPASPPVEPGVKEVTNNSVSQAAELVNGTARKAPAVPNKAARPANEFEHLNPNSKVASTVKAHPEDSDWAVE